MRSKNQHGVHSPFVFDLITRCFYDRSEYRDYREIINFRRDLLKNKSPIEITDLGSGSKVSKPGSRLISDLAKGSGTTIKRAKLLYRLSHYFQFKNVLELGTSLGIATHALSLGNRNSKITTIEGCPNIAKFTVDKFKQYDLTNIEILRGDFKDVIQHLKPESYDLIFFDGNHKKEPTLEYFDTLLSCVHNETVFIFDDIYWSKGMTEAWKTMIEHPKVTVSIDTFSGDLYFSRKEQAKEHFIIRV